MIRLGPFRPLLFITLSPPFLPPVVFTTLHSLLHSVFVSLSVSGIMSGPQAHLASELSSEKPGSDVVFPSRSERQETSRSALNLCTGRYVCLCASMCVCLFVQSYTLLRTDSDVTAPITGPLSLTSLG